MPMKVNHEMNLCAGCKMPLHRRSTRGEATREANRDNPLVFLLGQDRRYLMHKRLAPILTPGSA